jgi:hypothetical protein
MLWRYANQKARTEPANYFISQLITAIGDYIDHHNENPKPFIWTAKASDTLEKSPCTRRPS